ncbi:MAG: peroxiredoxin family protein [Phormidesmis sp.]
MRAIKFTSTGFRGLLSPRFFNNLLPVPARCQFRLGQLVPDIALQGISQQTHQLSGYRGRPVVLAFTRIFTEKQYCPFCYPHILALNEAYQQFVALGAELLMVTSTPIQQSQTIQQDLSLSMPLLTDPTCESFRLYKTGQALGAPLPAQFVIDEEGKLRFQHLFSFAHTNATSERLLWAVRNL